MKKESKVRQKAKIKVQNLSKLSRLMGKILIPILLGVAASASLMILSLIKRIGFSELINQLKSGDFFRNFSFSSLTNRSKATTSVTREPLQSIECPPELDLNVLNCRVKLSEQEDGGCVHDAFEVEICGSIHAPSVVKSATLKISILDTTEPNSNTIPAHAQVKQWQEQNSSVFCYKAKLGKLPNKVTTISDWTSIAMLRLDWLQLPRQGNRQLQFNTSILSDKGKEQLACADCYFTYDNQNFGYLDLKDNIKRSKTLTVALAFSVSAVNKKLYNSEIKLIKKWARENIDLSEESSKERRKLEKALNETIEFFRNGNKLNSYDICREIVEIVPLADRYEIMNLCLYVAQANGSVTQEELNLLKDFADWLEIEADKFREMVQKILPVDMYEVKDVETILGVTSNMNKEKARRQLNKEYSKWNARVTNADPEIQSQADQMLKLIAEARSQYIG
jgi:tellurite resistance protein